MVFTRLRFNWKNNMRYLRLPLTIVLLLGSTMAASAQEQLPNFPDAPPKAGRFPLTDRIWSDASICMWADDKLAAMSFTVDDNCYGNVAWWMETAEKYGFKVTWFLITDRITKGENSGFNGTWEKWRAVKAAGHDLQSHTALHLHTELAEWAGIDDEYRVAQAQIESNIPGHKCDFLAYPGGANTSLNNRTNAIAYYAANRGGSGSGFNSPNKIDYFTIKSMGGNVNLTNPAVPSSYLPNIFNKADARYYRGWAVLLWHLIKDYNAVTPLLDFIDANKADLWLCTFGEGAKYGQERDTATLKIDENTPDRIALTLTDRMLDSRFDYPLTLKVRLPSGWKNVQAMQNGQGVKSSVIVYEGVSYALVNAMPDRGQVVLASAALNN
jgi:peptidoglycan/xylan/chitin deacetylase (PgdA/CDA1 family)